MEVRNRPAMRACLVGSVAAVVVNVIAPPMVTPPRFRGLSVAFSAPFGPRNRVQAPPVDGTSTSVPLDGTVTPAIEPPTPTAEPVATSTTTSTTLLPVDQFGLGGETGADGLVGGQGAFDLASMAVLTKELGAVRQRLSGLERRLAKENAALDILRTSVAEADGALATLGEEGGRRVAAVGRARSELRRRAVQAFVASDLDLGLIDLVGDPVEFSRARSFLEALVDGQRRALRGYLDAEAHLDAAERTATEAAIPGRVAASDSEARVALLFLAVTAARAELDAYVAGSHVFVPGFRFPVLGAPVPADPALGDPALAVAPSAGGAPTVGVPPVESIQFVDSWGAPRLAGTPLAHWHEGTDIMAPLGTPLVAVEAGTVFKVGVAGLGGNRVWLHGNSGTDFYYAHLSRFAPGAVDGREVVAGEVLGYVGDTGDARGGPPHLHFEIHPGGGPAVNPFPLLSIAWGARRPSIVAAASAGSGSDRPR